MSEQNKVEQYIDTPEFWEMMDKYAHESFCEEFDKNEYDASRKAIIEYLASQSHAPIPEQVAQANSIEGLTRYYTNGIASKHGNYVRLADVERLLATQSAKQAPVAQEVTQQAAKAETAKQAMVDLMPKRTAFFAWAKNRRLDVTEEKDAWGKRKFGNYLVQLLWEGWFHAPATYAMPEQSSIAGSALEGGNTNAKSSDLAPTTSTVSAPTEPLGYVSDDAMATLKAGSATLTAIMPRAIIGADQAIYASAQAAADDVWNEALEAAAKMLLNGYFLHDQAPPKLFAGEAAKAIREMKRTAAQAATDKSED